MPGHSRLSTFIVMRFGWGTNVQLFEHKFRAFLCDYVNESSTTEVCPRLTLMLTQHWLRFVFDALYLEPARECSNVIYREESKDGTNLRLCERGLQIGFFFFQKEEIGVFFFQESHWFRDLYFACFWTILFNPSLFQS